MTILRKLEKSLDVWFLIIFLTFFFFLRLPSLFEPYWYGDEGIYQTLGLALNRGALLYRDIWDNKPPGLYFLYSVFGSDQFLLRLVSLLAGIGGVSAFFALSKKLFNKPFIYRASTFIFLLLFGLPMLEGNIANAENFMVPLALFSAYLLIRFLTNKQKKPLLFLSGLILGISFLFKIVAIFDFGAFLLFLYILDFPDKLNIKNLKNHLRDKFSQILIFTTAFLLPFFITITYFLINQSLSLYLESMFFSNINYVGYGNKFLIPQGFLYLKIFLLAVSLLLIFLFRKNLKFPAYLFITLWFSFSFFNAFFSQRPYPHYVLVLVPSFCLFLGSIFLYKKLSKIIAAIFIVSIFIIGNYFSLYGKSLEHYLNFANFVFDDKKVAKYQSFFDRNTPRDYKISAFIKSNTTTSDNIFIWGNNAQLYKLTGKLPPGKYTTLYHIVQYPDGKSNTKLGLEEKKPKFIVLMSERSPYPFSLYNYRERINIEGARIYERNI